MNASDSVPPLGPAKAAVKQWVDLTFEIAGQVFDLQHDLALELVDLASPVGSGQPHRVGRRPAQPIT